MEEEETGARHNNEDKYKKEERGGFQPVEEGICQEDKDHITKAPVMVRLEENRQVDSIIQDLSKRAGNISFVF